ncbi:hypothetical protein [Paenibacillus sp. MDMC362]|uniref:hypothetical protein n=1 Tax=Paenibacillus sp. MDMC362 TaxID=2977365 RepID=UPI000DC4AEA5|nr:hypothetical protein [Paenibacillus sp. MDMC362]RAR41036.1 hypothetical protein DP091_25955 [Paenibacillus sp. MDMC362]
MKKVLILFLMTIVCGCQSKSENSIPTHLISISLTKIYPRDISNVNKVELLDGSTGERKTIVDERIIQEWLNKIKEIELIPDDNQEQRSGYIFGITLFENEDKILGFIPNEINNIYYKANEAFLEPTRALFEEQFGRKF